jgi:hypothetical protein
VSERTSRLEQEVRRTLSAVADEGRHVPLGRRALAGVRRRRKRRTRALTGVAALALAAAALPRLLGADGSPTDPAPDVTGRNVVASYSSPTEYRVLNPATGEYRRSDVSVEAVTEDLRYAVGTTPAGYPSTYPVEDPRLGVLATRTGELEWFDMPDQVAEPAWSPDARYVVARLGEPGSARAVVLEPAERKLRTVDLEVPVTRLVVSLCWSDVDRLLAVTTPRPGEPAGTQELMVFDPDGWALRTMSIPDTWTVTCKGRHGRVLLTRLAEQRPTASVVPPEVAVADLNTGGLGAPVPLPWAGAIQPVAWRSDRSFLAVSQEHILVVDLDAATITETHDPSPADHGPAYSLFVPAEGLRRYADDIYDFTF